MKRQPRDITLDEWKLAYSRWLDGTSLSALARDMGISCSGVVKTYLIKHFGKDAVNISANSFIRSMRADYPGNTYVNSLLSQDHKVDQRYYSKRSLVVNTVRGAAKLKNNKSVEMSYRIAYQEQLNQTNDPWEALEANKPLSLVYVITVLQVVTYLLHSLLTDNGDIPLYSPVYKLRKDVI